MPTYTTRVEGRDTRKLQLTTAEAQEMAAVGFRFAVFEEGHGEFRLSLPYRTAENLDRGTLTIVQEP